MLLYLINLFCVLNLYYYQGCGVEKIFPTIQNFFNSNSIYSKFSDFQLQLLLIRNLLHSFKINSNSDSRTFIKTIPTPDSSISEKTNLTPPKIYDSGFKTLEP